MDTIDQVVAGGPFQAAWESLKQYTVPSWYQDGKFGIFIHWGVYSVPAFGNEWYPRNMYLQGSPEFKHHVETYGPQSRFGYKDFIPRFNAEKFNAGDWAEVFRRAGARYVVPVAEHHDGFAMYDCSFSEWNAVKMGPKRDIIGELAAATRKQGLVFGLSSHRAEHWWFMNGGMTVRLGCAGPALRAASTGPRNPRRRSPTRLSSTIGSCAPASLVDKYQPQLVWFDWWIEEPAFEAVPAETLPPITTTVARSGAGAWPSTTNIKLSPKAAAVFDIERGQLSGIRPLFWQTDTAISKNSWGYVQNQDYKTAGDLVGDLVDIVSKNGALLLNIGPRPDGTLPEPEQRILLEIGQWLAVNGEAIYGTRPWKVFGEGPTQVDRGILLGHPANGFYGPGHSIHDQRRYAVRHRPGLARRATRDQVDGQVCATLGWRSRRGHLLGHEGQLEWSRDESGLTVKLPDRKPCEHAFALKITGG